MNFSGLTFGRLLGLIAAETFRAGDKICVNLHHGKIEDAIVRAVIQDGDRVTCLETTTCSFFLLPLRMDFRS